VWKARWQGTLVALKVVPLHASLKQEEKQARMAIMEAALSGTLPLNPISYCIFISRLLGPPEYRVDLYLRDPRGQRLRQRH